MSLVLFLLSIGIIHVHCDSLSGGEQKQEPQITCFDDKLSYKAQSTWVKTESKCTDDKSEILKFCQNSYPKLDISNIVQVDAKTWRCLESPFQSDALLVPSPCIFDHIHNTSICQGSLEWNFTAKDSCFSREMKLKSYSVLLPCGIGLFTGVEFVCCPLTPATTQDPYFSKYNVKNEHENFIEAEERLEERHRERIDKIMKEWNGLEDRYQTMRAEDGDRAEKFKKTVTERFQKTIKALEEEGEAEKKQLISIHQQRIHHHLNEKKREALECFTNALADRPQYPPRIRKCLEKLMRILNKSRHHVLSHFRHLARKSVFEAEEILETTLQRLDQISKTAKDTIDQIDRYPKLREVRNMVEDYVNSLQGSDDFRTILNADKDSDRELLSRYTSIPISPSSSSTTPTPTTTTEATSTWTPRTWTEEQQTPSKVDTIRISHSEKFMMTNEQPSYIVRREVFHRENKTVYITMAFAGLAVFGAMVIGLYVLRRRGSPRGKGFLQVSFGSPEEKYVSNKQVNGYENPTYKYFEGK